VATPESAAGINRNREINFAREAELNMQADRAEQERLAKQAEADQANQWKYIEYQQKRLDTEAARKQAEADRKAADTRFERTQGLTERTYAEAEAQRKATLAKAEMEEQDMAAGQPLKALANTDPYEMARIKSEFFKGYDLPDSMRDAYQKDPKPIDMIIVSAVNRGVAPDKIADALQATPKSVPMTGVSGLWGLRSEPGKPSNALIAPPAGIRPAAPVNGLDAGRANLNPAPDPLATARALVADLQAKKKADPTFTLSLAEVKAYRAAKQAIQGQPLAPTAQAPQASAPAVPKGPVVSDQQLADLNGDGVKDQKDAEIKSEAEAAYLVVERAKADEKAGKLTAKRRMQMDEASAFIKQHAKSLGAKYSAFIEQR
jgi:hypothetical protein